MKTKAAKKGASRMTKVTMTVTVNGKSIKFKGNIRGKNQTAWDNFQIWVNNLCDDFTHHGASPLEVFVTEVSDPKFQWLDCARTYPPMLKMK